MEWTRVRPRQVAIAPQMRPWERRRLDDMCLVYKVVRLLRQQEATANPPKGQWGHRHWRDDEVPLTYAVDQLFLYRRSVNAQQFKAAYKYTCLGARKWKPPIEERLHWYTSKAMLWLMANPFPHGGPTSRVETNQMEAMPHTAR